ncbi:GNAT family N-acetyltransferase [Noviherbaspirillum sedimenti]|nr:GNAT family N-acetyltransferase [Noviherbaspirillum sedimenti]
MTTIDGDEQSDGITIACYMNEVPLFVEAELVRLYDMLYSSMPFFKAFRSTEQLSSYVAWRNNHPIAIFVFQFRDGKIDVLNEMIEIDQVEIDRFAHTLFAKVPAADIISFKALKTDRRRFSFPSQRCYASDTYVIALPATSKAYTAALGKSTRTAIKYQMNKVARDHPSFTSRFYADEDIDEQHIRDILKLSEARISSKAFNFSHDEKRIINLVKMCGLVNVLFIDGRLCAGSINYRIGSSYFGAVIGQDFAYEKYGLGKLTVYLTICESIDRHGKNFYLGGGPFDYKGRMLGVQQVMDRLDIYRSYGKLMLNFGSAAKTVMVGYVRRLNVWLHKHEHKSGARFVLNSYYLWKNLRKKDS